VGWVMGTVGSRRENIAVIVSSTTLMYGGVYGTVFLRPVRLSSRSTLAPFAAMMASRAAGKRHMSSTIRSLVTAAGCAHVRIIRSWTATAVPARNLPTSSCLSMNVYAKFCRIPSTTRGPAIQTAPTYR